MSIFVWMSMIFVEKYRISKLILMKGCEKLLFENDAHKFYPSTYILFHFWKLHLDRAYILEDV